MPMACGSSGKLPYPVIPGAITDAGTEVPMNDAWIKNLTHCPLFAGISETDMRTMLTCFKPRVAGFKRGEYVCLEGDEQETIGVLLSGRLNVNRETMAGNKMVMAVLSPGDLFGEMAAFSGRNKWPASVSAVETSEVMFILTKYFSYACGNVCDHHGLLILNMLGIISQKALLLNRKVEYLTVKGMREKLSRYLMEQYRNFGSPTFTMDMNRNELADFLNVSRPSMSRELGRMRDEGFIDFYRGSVRILMPDQLLRFCPEGA
jgi:CRP-like cAMP-binding protein